MRADLATDTEVQLSEMWADVLGVDSVSRGDNFFDLGGDSMLATRLVLTARRAWSVEFNVRLLVESPVLKDMASRIDELVTGADAGP